MPPLQYVRPGDLITAEFMNRIIDELQSLRSGIGAGSTSVPGRVAIDRFEPPHSVRIGDELTIFGSGFGRAESNVVTFGSEIVTSFKGGSGVDRLILTVPPMPGVGAGTVVSVTVGNSNGTARADNVLLVLPFQASRPEGGITITPSGNPGIQLTSGGPPVDYTFDMKLYSNLDERYNVTATITGAGWTAAIKSPTGGSIFIPKADPPAGTTRPIVVTITPGTAANALLKLTAKSQANASFTNTREVQLALNSTGPTVQDQVTVSFSNTVGSPGNVNAGTGLPEIPANAAVTFFFTAEVPQTGAATDDYQVVTPIVFTKLDGSAATGWSVNSVIPSGNFGMLRGGQKPVKIDITADAQPGTPQDVKATVKVKSTTRASAVGEVTQQIRRV